MKVVCAEPVVNPDDHTASNANLVRDPARLPSAIVAAFAAQASARKLQIVFPDSDVGSRDES